MLGKYYKGYKEYFFTL